MLLRVYVSSVGKTNATLVRVARFDSALAYCIRTVDGYALGQATMKELPALTRPIKGS